MAQCSSKVVVCKKCKKDVLLSYLADGVLREAPNFSLALAENDQEILVHCEECDRADKYTLSEIVPHIQDGHPTATFGRILLHTPPK
jgi:RNase P subunit RPR2